MNDVQEPQMLKQDLESVADDLGSARNQCSSFSCSFHTLSTFLQIRWNTDCTESVAVPEVLLSPSTSGRSIGTSGNPNLMVPDTVQTGTIVASCQPKDHCSGLFG